MCVCVCAHTMCESCLTDYCVRHVCSGDAVFWPGMLCIYFFGKEAVDQKAAMSPMSTYVFSLIYQPQVAKKKVVDKTAAQDSTEKARAQTRTRI